MRDLEQRRLDEQEKKANYEKMKREAEVNARKAQALESTKAANGPAVVVDANGWSND